MELYLASLTPLDPHINKKTDTGTETEILIRRLAFDDTFKVA